MTILKTHVLFVTPAFPKSEHNSHTVVYFANFIKAYQQSRPDHKISIISIQLPEKRMQYEWNGINVHALGSYGQPKWKKISTYFMIHKIANQINEHDNITVIHALWLKQSAFVGKSLAKRLGVPLICTVMGMELRGQNPYLKFLDLSKMHLVLVSKRQYTLHKDQLSKTRKIDIIPWGIGQETVYEDQNSKRKYDILFVGFLNENKNLDLFIQIISKLKANNQSLRALVVGDFFNLDEWQAHIKKLDLQGQIEFTGLISNKEVLNLMRQSKILLHTANYESLGYVMLEALSQGMYIVSKNVGIAEKSDRWWICEKLSDFESAIYHILNNYKPISGITPYPLPETVNSYSSLYVKHSS